MCPVNLNFGYIKDGQVTLPLKGVPLLSKFQVTLQEAGQRLSKTATSYS
jgi:hypothetical protein